MRLYFIRHAHAETQNDPGIVAGRAEKSPLTALGLRQADLLAAALGGFAIDRVITSTCLRAEQTALPVALALHLPLEANTLLAERSQGEFEGREKDTVYTPDIVKIIHADQWRWKPPGGESLEEVATRMRQFLQQLSQNQTPLIVTHSMLLWALFRMATGCDPAVLPRLPLDNCALVEIEMESADNLKLIRWNHALLRDVSLE